MNFGAPENKHKFNGIEQNNDFDLNMYDAFYRNLDPQIGRFWQVDPVTTHSESPYVAMQNNPVSKFDWLGDYFTWANAGLEDRYKRLRKENADRITGYMNELSKLDINSQDEKVQKQIKELTGLINAHGELNSQWNEMEQSAIEFHVSDDVPQEKSTFGDTRFNIKNNRIDIRAGRDDKYNGLSNMAHEIRHGYSYISGEVIVGRNDLYDMTDEVVAYNAGFLFLDKGTASRVVNGYYNVDWFKENKLSGYNSLIGR